MVLSVLTLGLAPWLIGLATVGFLFICLLLCLIVLIQRPQGGGLSGAFGAGGGSGQTAFGAKTGDALTIATVSIFVLFLVGAVLLNFAIRPSEERPATAEQTSGEQAPATAGESTGETPPETTTETPVEAPVETPDEGVTPEDGLPPADPGAATEPPVEVPPSEGGGR